MELSPAKDPNKTRRGLLLGEKQHILQVVTDTRWSLTTREEGQEQWHCSPPPFLSAQALTAILTGTAPSPVQAWCKAKSSSLSLGAMQKCRENHSTATWCWMTGSWGSPEEEVEKLWCTGTTTAIIKPKPRSAQTDSASHSNGVYTIYLSLHSPTWLGYNNQWKNTYKNKGKITYFWKTKKSELNQTQR